MGWQYHVLNEKLHCLSSLSEPFFELLGVWWNVASVLVQLDHVAALIKRDDFDFLLTKPHTQTRHRKLFSYQKTIRNSYLNEVSIFSCDLLIERYNSLVAQSTLSKMR